MAKPKIEPIDEDFETYVRDNWIDIQLHVHDVYELMKSKGIVKLPHTKYPKLLDESFLDDFFSEKETG